MMRKPDNSSNSKASTVYQPPMTVQALKRFQRPSQLWRGYTALAARNLPFTAIQFPMFEFLKESIKQYRKDKGIFSDTLLETGLVTAISAGSAGSIAAVITTPVDVVKTRIMLSAAGESSEAMAQEEVEKVKREGKSLDKWANSRGATRKSGLTVAREVMSESGVRGLFRGGILRAAWTAFGSGLYLGVYESGRVWLGDRHPSDGDEGNP